MSIYLKDDFNDNSLDLTKWQQYAGVALLVEQNKRLETTQPDGTGAWVETVSSYSIAGKTFQVEAWANNQSSLDIKIYFGIHRFAGVINNRDAIMFYQNQWQYNVNNGGWASAWDVAPPTWNQNRKYLLEIRYSEDKGTIYFYIDKILRKTVVGGIDANNGILNLRTSVQGRFDNVVIQDVAEAS